MTSENIDIDIHANHPETETTPQKFNCFQTQ